MYFILLGVPSAIVFALAQIFACKKAKRKIHKFIPSLVAAGLVVLVPVAVLIEPLSNILAEKLMWGLLAALVYCVIFGVAGIIGCAAGFIFYKIYKKKRAE